MNPIGRATLPIMPGAAEAPKSASKSPAQVLSRFHSLMLQQAFKAMLQPDPASGTKSNFARDVWRDQLAEKLANAATVSGGLGPTSGTEKP